MAAAIGVMLFGAIVFVFGLLLLAIYFRRLYSPKASGSLLNTMAVLASGFLGIVMASIGFGIAMVGLAETAKFIT